jgi:hypothetical protein
MNRRASRLRVSGGVAAMKATGAGEEEVLRIALRIYRDSDFKLIS